MRLNYTPSPIHDPKTSTIGVRLTINHPDGSVALADFFTPEQIDQLCDVLQQAKASSLAPVPVQDTLPVAPPAPKATKPAKPAAKKKPKSAK